MVDKNHPFIIVGGGIGGMTLGLALAKKNIPSLVLEQAPQFRETGAGILLCPNVFKMFDYLGISEQMTAIACFPDALIYADGLSGFEYIKIPMGKEVVTRFKYPYGSFHREELLRALVKECQQSPLITLTPAARIVGFEEKNERVFATSDAGITYEGTALVGCDGLWSLVRNYIIENEKPRYSGHVTHRGVVAIDKVPEHIRPNTVIHWDLPNAHMVQYPMGTKGMYNIVAVYKSVKPHQFEDTKGDPEELFERFEGARPEIQQLLAHVDTTKLWLLCDRKPVSHWSKGRMTLLGDSAHPTLPHLTQGAGMAIEDAVVLAEKVSASNGHYEAAFQAYEKERYLRTAFVQYFSSFYGNLHDADGIARDLRNEFISKMSLEEKYTWLGKLYNGIEP
jgi:salicylate hydroxylase